jgi:hypothetical protein
MLLAGVLVGCAAAVGVEVEEELELDVLPQAARTSKHADDNTKETRLRMKTSQSKHTSSIPVTPRHQR